MFPRKNLWLTQKASMLSFALSIIGEAAKRISTEFKDKYPDIPWRDMAGTRDVLTHDYEGVDAKIIWDIAHYDLLPLAEKLSQLLK
jgi:uncharacterized protein with HEPN domain